MQRIPKAKNGFPAGSVYEATFGNTVVDLHFNPQNVLAYTVVKGPYKGMSERVTVSVVPVRPRVILVSWKESNKSTVVQLDDFEKGITYSWVTRPNGKLIRFRGTLKRLETPVLCA